jgi:3-phenylpropionate/cinnamic acid dioxygenase small subunit
MIDITSSQIAAQVLYQEAGCLDTQDWDGWLDLYPEELEYWVPAWKNESELVSNVKREVSLIYHTRHRELADRVLRIRSRKSVTAMPLPRTTHLVTNVLAQPSGEAGHLRGTAAWTVHEYDPRLMKSYTHFGRYEFELQPIPGAWRIGRKKIILMNDLIPTVIDFYNL